MLAYVYDPFDEDKMVIIVSPIKNSIDVWDVIIFS